MSERLTHSKLAVASTILPVAVWLYLGLSGLILSWRPFWKLVDRVLGDSLGALRIFIGLLVILF